MPWTAPSTAIAGSVLTAAFWNAQVRDNLLALKSAGAGGSHLLGGNKNSGHIDTSFTDVDGFVDAVAQFSGPAVFRFMGFVDGGTGTTRLYDRTAAAAVASSETTFTETSPTPKTSASVTLVAGHVYRLQVKVSSAAQIATAYGGQLVEM